MEGSKSNLRQRQPRLGLTLLELVAATLLAAMLCVAVMGITADSARRHQAVVSQIPTKPWLAQLSEQIRWDILQARSFRVQSDGLELHGFGSRDFGTSVAYHGPAIITYQIIKVGDVRWLLRRETHTDDLTSNYVRTDFVCTNVEALRLASLSGRHGGSEQKGGPLSDLLDPTQEQELQAEGPLPERVVVTLRGSAAKEPILREVIFRR